MKIICVGKNYKKHVEELNSHIPAEPVIFMKPDSSLLLNNKPFFLPDFSDDLQHEVEVVVKINRLGKHIHEEFAHRYYDEVTVGIDFTARDLQNNLIKKGHPWELSKAFDGSAVLGEFVRLDQLEDQKRIHFKLDVNGKTLQNGRTSDALFSIDQIIVYVSKFVTLKMGDLIFMGTPSGVGPVKINDRLEAWIENKKLLDFLIK